MSYNFSRYKNMKYCSKCGYACQDDDKFCTRCGAKLQQLVENPQPAPAQAVVQPMPVPPPMPYPIPQPVPQEQPKPNQTSAILALVFGILGGVFYIISMFFTWIFGVFTLGFAIPALILGVKTRKDGKGLAGMIMSIVVLSLMVITLVVVLLVFFLTVGVWWLYI